MIQHDVRERLTRKQQIILEEIQKGDGSGDFIDLDQLLERLPYDTSKESMQFSIRALVRRRLIRRRPYEVRRGRKRAVYEITSHGARQINDGLPQGVPIADLESVQDRPNPRPR